MRDIVCTCAARQCHHMTQYTVQEYEMMSMAVNLYLIAN